MHQLTQNNNPPAPSGSQHFTNACTEEELDLACLRWCAGADAVLTGIINTPPLGGTGKFLDTRLRRILKRLIERGACGLARYLLASRVEAMLDNLNAKGPQAVARALYRCACEVIDLCAADDRPAMKRLAPDAERIREAAGELMV